MKFITENILGVAVMIMGVAMISYDQYDNYQWRTSYQLQCDTEGC